MQLNSVYLYPNKIDVYTNVPGTWLTERYRRVYNRNLKIYSGADNTIDVQVKNADQKPVDVTGATMVFNLVTRDGQKLILSKECTVVDLTKGKVSVTITESDLYDLQPGFYQYSVHKESGTTKTPLYVDSQYGAVATLEVGVGIQGTPTNSVEVTKFQETRPATTGETNPTFFTSSVIDANYQRSTPQSNHTFALYGTGYAGHVEIQASMDEGTASKWSTIGNVTFNGEPIKYSNIVGKWRWFRIRHTPNSIKQYASFTIAQTILNAYEVTIGNNGLNYAVGNTITFKGDQLGGETPTNDLVITVTAVDSNGAITAFTHSGLSYNGVRTFVLTDSLSTTGTFDRILYR